MGAGNGFVWNFCKFGADGFEAVEILDSAAVEALGLGLVAEKEFPGLGVFGKVAEAFGEDEVLLLAAAHLEGGVAEVGVEEVDRFGVAGIVEAGGEEAAFEAGGAEEVLLGEGDALNGEEFLGVGGVVEGDEVFAEFDDVVEAFENGDGEVGGCKKVCAGVLGRSSFAFGGAGARGTAGVGLVGGDLPGGSLLGHLDRRSSMRGRGSLKSGACK